MFTYNSSKLCRGFTAMIAVFLLALATCAISATITGAAYFYTDSVIRHELRIQARLNAESCLNYIESMLAGDFNLRGNFYIQGFGCQVNINEIFAGNLTVNVQAKSSSILNVSAYGNETLLVGDTFLKRTARSI